MGMLYNEGETKKRPGIYHTVSTRASTRDGTEANVNTNADKTGGTNNNASSITSPIIIGRSEIGKVRFSI